MKERGDHQTLTNTQKGNFFQLDTDGHCLCRQKASWVSQTDAPWPLTVPDSPGGCRADFCCGFKKPECPQNWTVVFPVVFTRFSRRQKLLIPFDSSCILLLLKHLLFLAIVWNVHFFLFFCFVTSQSKVTQGHTDSPGDDGGWETRANPALPPAPLFGHHIGDWQHWDTEWNLRFWKVP